MTEGGTADLRGDGEFMMKIRRVLPDFLSQTGDAVVTLNLKDFPNDTQLVHHLDHLQLTVAHRKLTQEQELDQYH